MRILIIEDDPDVAGFLEEHLPEHGFACDVAPTGEEALRLANLYEHDVILLDLQLPDMDGEEVLHALREERPSTPIIMLTAMGDTEAKVRLLSAGADDYIEKPYSFEELMARIRAVLRRSHDMTPDILRVGDLMLDARARKVAYAGKPLELTGKEFSLLEYLMRNQGTVVSKEKLIEHVWSAAADPFSNVVETHLTNLRRKLPGKRSIHTVHGRGYMIEA